MSDKTYDIALVGGGIAGACLAYVLKTHYKKNIVWFDNEKLSSSSRVAAGIYNPIVFKRTTVAWKGAALMEECAAFYDEAEKNTSTKFHYRSKIQRVLSGYEEQNEWLRKSILPGFNECVSDNIVTGDEKLFNAPFGIAEITKAGWIITTQFIEAIKNNCIGKENCIDVVFDYNALKTTNEALHYANYSFKQIAFCEGHLIKNNPWFNFIQLYPVKGDVLEVEINGLPNDKVYNGGVYVAPHENGLFRIGSTYDWKNLTETIDENAKNEMLEKIKSFCKAEITIKNHLAGIRPAAKDRKPIVGKHYSEKNMFVLNGLGTKGVSLAPYCAKALAEAMLEEKNVDSEINVQRFYP